MFAIKNARRIKNPLTIFLRNFSTKPVQEIKLPQMDWDDWIEQYPSFARREAELFKKKCIDEESAYSFKSNSLDKIDWDYWNSVIKTPGLVATIRKNYEAVDNSDYGSFYFDNLTDEARSELLADGSPYEQEAQSIGKNIIREGVEKTLKNDIKKKIESATEMSEKAVLILDELYKDKEQLDERIKRFAQTSNDELLAEYPQVAREIEEIQAGNAFGNGHETSPEDEGKMRRMHQEKPNLYDKESAEISLRQQDRSIDDYLGILDRMGFQIDKESFIKNKFDEWQKEMNRLREYCRKARESNSIDPVTKKEILEDRMPMTEIRGGG